MEAELCARLQQAINSNNLQQAIEIVKLMKANGFKVSIGPLNTSSLLIHY